MSSSFDLNTILYKLGIIYYLIWCKCQS